MTVVGGAFGAQDEYGAEEANTKYFFDPNQLGGRDEFNYTALRDHTGPSGVPLGGIGMGCLDLAPTGQISRVGINNFHHIPHDDYAKGCFFAVWEKRGDQTAVRRLVRNESISNGMPGYKHSTYTGLFPTAKVSFDNGSDVKENLSVSIYAYSGLVPQNVKDSSLPVAWFEVELSAKEACEASVAISWEDLIGRNLKDIPTLDGVDGQVLQGRNKLVNGEQWPFMQRVRTYVKPYNNGNLIGVMHFAKEPFLPKKWTYQNYCDNIAVVTESDAGEISYLPNYRVDKEDPSWASFVSNGSFKTSCVESILSNPESDRRASAIAVKTSLDAGESKTFRFAVTWWCPQINIDKATAKLGSYFDDCDYNRYMHNYFADIDQLIAYAAKERPRILRETVEWHKPVLASTMPDWLKFKLINSAYTIYTNTILTKGGDFTVLEGAMGGLAGTMDQRISAHPFYQKFFTQIDRSEMQLFADNQDEEGFILHFIGHYYVGMACKGRDCPTKRGYLHDNTHGWILQLQKDYEQTGDLDYLTHNAERVFKGMAFMRTQMPAGLEYVVGRTTYDDYDHPPVYSYMGGVHLATLKAAAKIAEAVNRPELAKAYNDEYEKVRENWFKMLWNGRFFAYGCEIDGSNRRDDILFTGQIAGQFISRYWGLGDILPMDMTRASLVSQFKTSISHTPDYYANKVWDLTQMKGIDRPGSQCWPFYLESYTAMNGIQAGYVKDGLDIMKHIQLVHLRKGWTWCQNLWNPGQVTYMTAPVTWFITDVLAGTHLDVPNKTLHISPVVIPGEKKAETPVYFPDFWGMVSFDPSAKKASLKVIKTFGDKRITIANIRSEPVGTPASDGSSFSIPEFTVREGAVLDLSPYFDKISGAVIHEPVLPQAETVDFIIANP